MILKKKKKNVALYQHEICLGFNTNIMAFFKKYHFD